MTLQNMTVTPMDAFHFEQVVKGCYQWGRAIEIVAVSAKASPYRTIQQPWPTSGAQLA